MASSNPEYATVTFTVETDKGSVTHQYGRVPVGTILYSEGDPPDRGIDADNILGYPVTSKWDTRVCIEFTALTDPETSKIRTTTLR